MAAKKKKADNGSEALPKAPMVEVVFEVRWKLQDGPAGVPMLKSDPGLVPLLERFSKHMNRIGFGAQRDMSHPLQTAAYGVARRFFASPTSPFPIQQIGPGIYATNEDSKYDWKPFKAQALKGLKALFDSYPKLDFFPLEIDHLELRFIDAFKPSLVNTKEGFLGFAQSGTNMPMGLPSMFSDRSLFELDTKGRFIVQRMVRARKLTKFIIDLGTATQHETDDIIRMETKIVTTGSGVPDHPPGARLLKELDGWLEFAHGILSPAFKELVNKDILAKYKLAT